MEKLIQHIHWEGDYHIWADMMCSMFKAYVLEACIEHAFAIKKDPSKTNKKNKDMACFAICVTLPIDMQCELSADMSTHEMWNTVRSYYMHEEEASKDAELD